MLGVIPAAGAGTRIQPLAFSKELLPVGVRVDGGIEHPRAVSEYLVERLIAAGADRLCFVISPGKSDILAYYGGKVEGVPVCYVVQPAPAGLCDAVFRCLPFLRPGEPVAVGLPDTVWFPRDALRTLPDDQLGFLLFPVKTPQLFDAVVTDEQGRVVDIQVKVPHPTSSWIWGAFKLPQAVLSDLHALWLETGCQDQYIGGLVNRYLARGGRALGVRAGVSYVDVGTLHGYREALTLLQGAPRVDSTTAQPPAPEARHESVRSSGP
jgi:glucose-1-phosphate thymidylyltransferase